MPPVGQHIRTPETRAKLRDARLGKTLSDETKAKISAFHRGRPKSSEARAKISASQTGSRNHRWKGGRVVGSGGYIYVHVPADDPMAVMRGAKRYVAEHRLVMARSLGRPILDEETIHHRNGIRSDNRLENLELRMGRHGKGFAPDDFTCPHCGKPIYD